MLFNSFGFLIFFTIVVVLYYLLPHAFRLGLILLASYLFYFFLRPTFPLLLAAITLVTYTSTRFLDSSQKARHKQVFYVVSLLLLLAPLLFFKYYPFLDEIIERVLFHQNWHLQHHPNAWVVPAGLSFYTFMAVGYLTDVYTESIHAERRIGVVAAFLSFFPLLLSGPIERAENMFKQFHRTRSFLSENLQMGLQWMIWGYFMKLVIADRLAIYTDYIFTHMPYQSGTTLLFGIFIYPIQVYTDLGGYSLIAIGCAKLLGFDVIQNFNRPFFATSMTELWRRWHISLISWLTDYIFLPLSFALRRYKMVGIVLALFITFILSGIWHGTSYKLIIWGAFQGFILSVEMYFAKRRALFEDRLEKRYQFIYFLFSICITYTLFSFSFLISGAFYPEGDLFEVSKKIVFEQGSLYIDRPNLAYALVGIVILFGVEIIKEMNQLSIIHKYKSSEVLRGIGWVVIALLIILIGVLDTHDFIYLSY